MTPSVENLLLKEVQPRLRSAIARTVPVVGSDDHEELLQDGLVIALRLLNGHCRLHSFEEPVFIDRSTDESLTLGEMLPARDDDPATQAGRRLDCGVVITRDRKSTRLNSSH